MHNMTQYETILCMYVICISCIARTCRIQGERGIEALKLWSWLVECLPSPARADIPSLFLLGWLFKLPPMKGLKLLSTPFLGLHHSFQATSHSKSHLKYSEAPYSSPRLQLFLGNDPMGTTIAIVVFYALADIVLLASLVSSCLIRKPRVYQKAIAFKSLFVSILGSIVWVLQQIPALKLISSSCNWYQCREISALVGTLLALLLGHAPYHTIAWMFNLFIGNLQYILIPNVLYRLIQAYTGNLKGYGRGRERCLLVKVHRIILTTLVILYLADIIIGFLIRYTVIPATNQKWEPGPAEKLWLAKRTVQFLVSLEIIVEMVILVRLPKKVSSQVGSSKRQPGKPFGLLIASRKEQSPVRSGRFSFYFWASYHLWLP